MEDLDSYRGMYVLHMVHGCRENIRLRNNEYVAGVSVKCFGEGGGGMMV